MKTKIHPTYHSDTKVSCNCGNTFVTGSTLNEIQVEICSNCHPFFTGEMRFVDTQGRVDKFESMRKRAKQLQQTLKTTKKQTAGAKSQPEESPKTLKEMMTEVLKQQPAVTAKSATK